MEAAHVFGPSGMESKMANLSLNHNQSKSSFGSLSKKNKGQQAEDGEVKKKGLFKMKW